LVNLCLNKPAIVELIQEDFTAKKIANQLLKLVQPSQELTQLMHDYQLLKQQFNIKNSAMEAALTIKNLAERH
jgi:lipid A disaccharide synthetase